MNWPVLALGRLGCRLGERLVAYEALLSVHITSPLLRTLKLLSFKLISKVYVVLIDLITRSKFRLAKPGTLPWFA